jgi:hypothetical protein
MVAVEEMGVVGKQVTWDFPEWMLLNIVVGLMVVQVGLEETAGTPLVGLMGDLVDL